jgi:hypothetical protein
LRDGSRDIDVTCAPLRDCEFHTWLGFETAVDDSRCNSQSRAFQAQAAEGQFACCGQVDSAVARNFDRRWYECFERFVRADRNRQHIARANPLCCGIVIGTCD